MPGIDVQAVVQHQRTATLRALQSYTRLKANPTHDDGQPEDLAWSLVLESLIFAAEAEVRWLDHCEARLARMCPPAQEPFAHDHEGVGGAASEAARPFAHDHEGVAR